MQRKGPLVFSCQSSIRPFGTLAQDQRRAMRRGRRWWESSFTGDASCHGDAMPSCHWAECCLSGSNQLVPPESTDKKELSRARGLPCGLMCLLDGPSDKRKTWVNIAVDGYQKESSSSPRHFSAVASRVSAAWWVRQKQLFPASASSAWSRALTSRTSQLPSRETSYSVCACVL